jgi:hypothetical protein
MQGTFGIIIIIVSLMGASRNIAKLFVIDEMGLWG